MKFEERVGRGAVIRPVQRFKYLFFIFIFYSHSMRIKDEVGSGDGPTHRDDIGVTHDGVGQRERNDDLEPERRHVSVHRDLFQCVQEAQVALCRGFGRRCRDCRRRYFLFFISGMNGHCHVMKEEVGGLTALVDDVEGGVCDVVVFEEEVFGRAGERAHEDRMVL